MDRFDAMRLFVKIVERASFADAGRDMQMPRASVTRAIQQLEAQLGVRLLERTTRAVRPTDDGRAYYGRCVDLLARLDETNSMFEQAEPRGAVCAQLNASLARRLVLPAIGEFIARHPHVSVQLLQQDRSSGSVADGVDCIVQEGTRSSPAPAGRQVADAEQLTLASQAYLERFGSPATPDDLATHRMVARLAPAGGQAPALEFMQDGEIREITLPNDISVQGTELYEASAIAGLGLAQMPRYKVEHQLASGELVPVLPDHPPPRLPISLVHPTNRHLSSGAQAFSKWLAELFRTARDEGRI